MELSTQERRVSASDLAVTASCTITRSKTTTPRSSLRHPSQAMRRWTADHDLHDTVDFRRLEMKCRLAGLDALRAVKLTNRAHLESGQRVDFASRGFPDDRSNRYEASLQGTVS